MLSTAACVFGAARCCMATVAARSCARRDPYYVTVAGLGGEPDYEQRFTALANDLDKLFRPAAATRTCIHLPEADATRRALPTR